MKKIFALILFLAVGISARAQLVTATVTVTNAPVNTSTLNISGTIFSWTNGTPIGNRAMQITNTVNGDATNMVQVTGLLLPFQGIAVTNSATNAAAFTGIGLTASITTGWATLTLSTNGTSPATNVIVPISNLTPAARTNVESQLVADENQYSTNPILPTSALGSLLAGVTNNNTMTGSNNLNNVSNRFRGNLGGTMNADLPIQSPNLLFVADFGVGFITGENIGCTNVDASAVTFLASADYTAPLTQWAVITNGLTVQPLGGGAYRWAINVSNAVPLYYVAVAGSTNNPPLTFPQLLLSPSGGSWVSTYPFAVNYVGTYAGSVGLGTGGDLEIHDAFNLSRIQVNKESGSISVNYGYGSGPGYAGYAAIQIAGNGIYFEGQSNQVLMQIVSNVLSGNFSNIIGIQASQIAGNIPQTAVTNPLNYNGTFTGSNSTFTNLTTAGTNALNGMVSMLRYNNGALANGNNQDVNLGTNVFTKFTSPTAAFGTAGFIGGIDDRIVIVENGTVQSWTINNDNGFESTPANRIYTGTGADVTLGQNSFAMFKYDASVTHWKLIFASGTPSSGGSGAFSGTFTGSVNGNVPLYFFSTNFVNGTVYTNSFGAPIQICAVVANLGEAGVVGRSALTMYVTNLGVATNYSVAQVTAIGGLTGSMSNAMPTVIIATNGTFSFVDTSTGAGNSATPVGGQILVH